eukprot:TRINITY_DN19677_c0_g1_i1.p1 TRINITY_DN19677_c0_g1~~TRINITY_DN19677_c0_g1_i1.p1  ORF type:complete len:220 (+),score=19.93 TRINITY_DN19677_c0_g1_i1:92-751(+)
MCIRDRYGEYQLAAMVNASSTSILVLGVLLLFVDECFSRSPHLDRRYSGYNSGGNRRRSSDSCYNPSTETETRSDQCEHECCWGDNCGSSSECQQAAVVAGVVVACLVVCICGCICWCFFKRKLCFGSCRKEGDESACHVVQQPVQVAHAAYPPVAPLPAYSVEQPNGPHSQSSESFAGPVYASTISTVHPMGAPGVKPPPEYKMDADGPNNNSQDSQV